MSQTSTPVGNIPPMRQPVRLPVRSFGETTRKDAWWLQPLLTFLGLGAFVVYSTWAALQNQYFTYEGYLSPFYSPLLIGHEGTHHGWFGSEIPSWIPSWIPFSPAFLILWAPGGFRFTCYYYRGAYYKAFWADPLNCAVGEPRKSYLGENWLPLILQNIHRYFLYLALAFLVLLTYDVILATRFSKPGGGSEFGIGLGTIILAVNVCLLSSYTLGCHSFRHLIGGKKDEISKSPVCHKAYNGVTCLNRKHMLFAWLSLFSVGFSDLYVRMLSMGVWHDWRIF